MTIPTAIVLWQQGFLQLDFNNIDIQKSVLASAGLGVVGSAVATALFYILVQRAGGLFASLVTYGIPFVALFWGFIDKEPITWIEIICLGIILVGVYLANRPDKKESETSLASLSQSNFRKSIIKLNRHYFFFFCSKVFFNNNGKFICYLLHFMLQHL